MNAEILCIGTELLHGDIVNTNAQYISKKFAQIGIDVHYQSVVGDNPDRMKEAFYLAFSRADVVICTGGLGPTRDDITKEILSDFFDLPMEFDEESCEHVKKMYSKFKKDMPENNMRQAYFPKGSIILNNPNGTANACMLKAKNKDGIEKIGILLPGPPKEMAPLVDNEVIPYLSKLTNSVVLGKKVIVTSVGESAAETMIMDLIENQTNPTIAPYASSGKVVFRVTAKAHTNEEAEKLINPVVDELLKRFGRNASLADSGNVEDVVAKLLLEKNISIATAESCTGGMVASKLISYPGISSVFKEGFVTYTNEAKMKRLNVQKETIDNYTEVSEECAIEMAMGAAKAAGADIGLSTTGYAGPGGGTEQNPVGTVYIAVFYKNEAHVRRLNCTGVREQIRERSTTSVLDLVRRIIE